MPHHRARRLRRRGGIHEWQPTQCPLTTMLRAPDPIVVGLYRGPSGSHRQLLPRPSLPGIGACPAGARSTVIFGGPRRRVCESGLERFGTLRIRCRHTRRRKGRNQAIRQPADNLKAITCAHTWRRANANFSLSEAFGRTGRSFLGASAKGKITHTGVSRTG
jgi:hypothetical protein